MHNSIIRFEIFSKKYTPLTSKNSKYHVEFKDLHTFMSFPLIKTTGDKKLELKEKKNYFFLAKYIQKINKNKKYLHGSSAPLSSTHAQFT